MHKVASFRRNRYSTTQSTQKELKMRQEWKMSEYLTQRQKCVALVALSKIIQACPTPRNGKNPVVVAKLEST